MPERVWWTPIGEPVLEPPDLRAQMVGADERLYKTLHSFINSPNVELPQIPQVAQRALSLSRDENVDYRKLAEVVEQDPVLTADFLRLANSVAFRGVSEMRRMDLVFARLGSRRLRTVLLGTLLKTQIIRTGGAQRSLGEELWRRALASGVVMARLAPLTKQDVDDAFLIGLLHDIGLMAVLKIVDDFQREVGKKVPRAMFDLIASEWHEHLGLRVADSWDLPDPLPKIISSHHRLPEPGGPHEVMLCAVMTCDAACTLLGFAPPYVPYDFWNLPCVRRLALQQHPKSRTELAGLQQEIEERIAII